MMKPGISGAKQWCCGKNRVLWLLIVLLLTSSFGVAHAQTGVGSLRGLIPDSIKPGAMEPRRSLKRPEFFVEPGGLELPEQSSPPEPDETGPRFRISGVRLKGALEDEDSGITLQVLDDIVSDHIDGSETMSLEQLRNIAADLTRFYRSRGYVLAQAFVPRQTVESGMVVIQIIPGLLGDVAPAKNKKYSTDTLRKPFRGLFDNPVIQHELETALLVVRDFPGLAASGVFTRGTKPGAANLKLLVEAEDRHEFFLNLDDYGSKFLGQYRARVDWVWNNPLGKADRLSIAGLHTVDPDNSLYGALDYTIPWFPGEWRTPLVLGLGVSHNEFDVGNQLEALGLNGTTKKAGLFLSRDFKRSRMMDLTGTLLFDRKHATTRREQRQLSQDDLSVFAGSLSLRAQDGAIFRQAGVTRASMDWSRGVGDFAGSMSAHGDPDSSRVGASGTKAGGDFDKVNLQLDRLQRLGDRFSMLLRLNGQWSDDLLVSLEQFPIGGPDSVRAFPLSTFLMDSGYFASAELAFDPPSDPYRTKSSFLGRLWRDSFRFSVFVDYGEGEINEPLASDFEDVSMGGAGLGLRLNFTDRFQLLFSAARPFGTRPPGFEQEDSTQYYLAMSLRL